MNKSVEENASHYFDRAKKARKKIDGVKKTLELFEKRKEQAQRKEQDDFSITKISQEKKYWYEKFKWFISSEGFLVVGARDATTNEVLIKKHVQENDIVFHTEMAGSPFVVIKKNKEDVKRLLKDVSDIKEPTQASLEEAAMFTFLNSKAWKSNIASAQVFFVQPSQVSKTANSGEYLTKGAFMIRGEKNFITPDLDVAVGVVIKAKQNPFVVAGPLQALETYCQEIFPLRQGNQKSGDIAKNIIYKIQSKYQIQFTINDVTHILPTGIELIKQRPRKYELKK